MESTDFPHIHESPGSTVTVSRTGGGTDTAARHGDYFFDAYALANTAGAVFDTLHVADNSSPPQTGDLAAFLAKTPEAFTYDDDGNLTSDGRWDYTHDAENRLVSMQTHSALSPSPFANADARRIEFTYDYLGRRVEKLVRKGYNGSTYTGIETDQRYVYNGWNLLATLDATASGLPVSASYTWGLDLSGTTQGAGGVGGLLMIQDSGNTFLPAYDAMGNLHALMTVSSATIGGTACAAGAIVAAYEYDAFGQTLRASGAYAADNPFRFSTKYTDTESGLVYYGHRFYSPSLGRFVNRDPIEEQGGLNLYSFCQNNAVNGWDLLGYIVYGAQAFNGLFGVNVSQGIAAAPIGAGVYQKTGDSQLAQLAFTGGGNAIFEHQLDQMILGYGVGALVPAAIVVGPEVLTASAISVSATFDAINAGIATTISDAGVQSYLRIATILSTGVAGYQDLETDGILEGLEGLGVEGAGNYGQISQLAGGLAKRGIDKIGEDSQGPNQSSSPVSATMTNPIAPANTGSTSGTSASPSGIINTSTNAQPTAARSAGRPVGDLSAIDPPYMSFSSSGLGGLTTGMGSIAKGSSDKVEGPVYGTVTMAPYVVTASGSSGGSNSGGIGGVIRSIKNFIENLF